MFQLERNFSLKSGKTNEILSRINIFNEGKEIYSYFQKKHIGTKKENSIPIMDLALFSK